MRRLGRYALLNRLSSGDRSDLFLARLDDRLAGDELAIGDAVALKLPRADVASDMEYARLILAEGAAAVRLRHKNIARTFEVDRIGPDLFTATELLLGQTLSSVLQRESVAGSALSPEVFLWIAAEVAAGLHAANQRSWSSKDAGPMVHGGLSPRSVMITYEGEVKLLGMGSGRARMYLPVPRSRLHYAAPETLTKRLVDRRIDLFALGVILHDALTGERLFRRATEAETRLAILEAEIPPVRRVLDKIHDGLGLMVEKMISRAPERRQRDAEEVGTQLQEMIGDRGPDLCSQLVRHLSQTFRDEREAQRRVLDAAIRRVATSVTKTPTDLSPVQRPKVRAPSTSRPSPVPLVAERMPSSLEELLPEIAPGQVPVLSEIEADETGDLIRADASFPDSLAPSDPNVEPSSPIPLVRRSSKPNGRAVATAPLSMEPIPLDSSGDVTHEIDRSKLPRISESDFDRWIDEPDDTDSKTLQPISSPLGAASAEDPLPPPPPLAFAEADLIDPSSETTPHGMLPVAVAKVDPAREEANFGAARYRKGEVLGVSEIATAYHATDAILGRRVALKISDRRDDPAPRFDQATRNKVLRREGRIAASLFHPRLATLLDAGRDGDLYFLAYQLVDGESLDRALERSGKLAPRAAAKVLLDLAEALAYMHGAGWLHGDVQPANVILEPDGRARLIDFSMVRGGDSEHPLPLAEIAARVPEARAGAPYDAVSEQYTLGALAYRMLTGESFESAGKRPRPPSDRDAEIDPRLSELVMRLLESDPGKRYPDLMPAIAELLRAIDAPRSVPRARSVAGTELPAELTPERLIGCLEQTFSRIDGIRGEEELSRDDPALLARATARRLGLRSDQQAIAGLIAAARGLMQRKGEVLQGLLPEQLLARVSAAGEASAGNDSTVEVVRVVEGYLNATRPGEDGRRVSPRRTVLALRDRADSGKLDPRAVEALIDHLREVISALDVPRRPLTARRVLLAVLHPNAALNELLQDQGFELELAKDGEEAWSRLSAGAFDGAIVDRALPRPRGSALLDRILDDARTKDLPLVILAGGIDDTLDEIMGLHGSIDVVARTAPPEQILRVLHQRLGA